MKTFREFMEAVGPGELAAVGTAYGALALVGGNAINRAMLALKKRKQSKDQTSPAT